MTIERRYFLKALSAAAIAGWLPRLAHAGEPAPLPNLIKPPRLQPGDTVGVINPGRATFNPAEIDKSIESLEKIGLKVKLGRHIRSRHGYLAGKDWERAADVNSMFADPSVRAIIPVRGGWGCNRILPLLDYQLIREHPKIIMGYSDITALLLAIYARSGVVTYHGPVGISTWNDFSIDLVRRILFNAEMVTLQNPVGAAQSDEEEDEGNNGKKNDEPEEANQVRTIHAGRSRGRLLGGNLSVLTAMIGSAYVPDWEGAILFLEDVRERTYRIDRMMTQLKLAGVLGAASGFVFGKCVHCGDRDVKDTFTVDDVLTEHVKPFNIPAWINAMIGHIEDKFTLPLGIEVEIDADEGTIRMLEPAVS